MIGDSEIGNNKICGGLRIKEIKNYLSTGQLATYNNYQYKWLSDDMNTKQSKSSGSIVNENKKIVERWQHKFEYGANGGLYTTTRSANELELNSSSYTSLYSYGGDYIGYSYVIDTNENGETRYNFNSFYDFPNDYYSYYMNLFGYDGTITYNYDFTSIRPIAEPQPPFFMGYYGAHYARGLLQNKYMFNSNNQKIYAEKNQYDISSGTIIYGWEVEKGEAPIARLGGGFEPFGKLHIANCYYHQIGQALLTEKEMTTYDLNGANPVTVLHKYQYNEKNQLSQDEVTNSNASTYKKEFKYPNDFKTVAPYSTMVSNNILSPIIEQSEYKKVSNTESQLLNKTKIDYKDWSNNLFAPEFIKKQTGNQSLPETRVTYYNYDSHGNPVYISKDNADKVVYLWGYKYQYPIAKIENATYAEVTAKINATNLDNIAKKDEPSASDSITINNLRSQLTDAMVTTFTYNPLVGVRTTIDPHGVKVTYHYDSFGRLQAIKDENNKVLEDYEYHYKP